jgi:hypothetical protein
VTQALPLATAANTRKMPAAFCFISSRLFEHDFRAPLINALAKKGNEVWHVRIGRRNVLTKPNGQSVMFDGVYGFLKLVSWLNACCRELTPHIIFVDTTGAYVPTRSLILRLLLRGVWCFDIFDNLLYDSHGIYRLKRCVDITLLARLCRIKIVLSCETLRLFPNAFHLDNAADTTRVRRPPESFTNLLILFEIGWRFDFGLVQEVAALAPDLNIYLYGRVASGDATIKRELNDLCAKCPNVIYRGEYRPGDVDTILAAFGIAFAPYVTDNALTEFINPDKYYLFLNSGMEVISTDIPQALRMEKHIHIGRSASEIVALVARIKSDRAFRKNIDFGTGFNWATRADDLLKLVQVHTL